jgi:hypothetical protein
VKKQVEIIILLLFGLVFLVYLFPFIFVEAAKVESGVTIKAPSTTETEKICDDTIDNDNDGKIDADDGDCGNAPATPMVGTCGAQIFSGVPINYGQLNPGAYSANQVVTIRNDANSDPAKVIIKGGDWIGDSAPNPIISGPEMTHVALPPNNPNEPDLPIGIGIATWEQKVALKSSGLELGYILPGADLSIIFQIKIPTSGISGSFHQEITIDLVC